MDECGRVPPSVSVQPLLRLLELPLLQGTSQCRPHFCVSTTHTSLGSPPVGDVHRLCQVSSQWNHILNWKLIWGSMCRCPLGLNFSVVKGNAFMAISTDGWRLSVLFVGGNSTFFFYSKDKPQQPVINWTIQVYGPWSATVLWWDGQNKIGPVKTHHHSDMPERL